MVLVGMFLEIAQNFVPGRSPEVADAIANTLGVVCGIILAFPFRAAAQTAGR
jgi:VanZ family protein